MVTEATRRRNKYRRQKALPIPAAKPSRRLPLAPVRRRRGTRYADAGVARAGGVENSMALLNAMRSQGKLEALHEQSKKTIGNLELRLGKAEATLRHKLDGHQVERDGDVRMAPPTAPMDNNNGEGATPIVPQAKPDTEMKGAAPVPTPAPMGNGTPKSNPGRQHQPAQRVARAMDVDSTTVDDFASRRRPSSSTLTLPPSRRSKTADAADSGPLSLQPAKMQHSRGDDDDDLVLGNKKPKSHGFGTAQVSAITGGFKKMRAQPGGIVSDSLALPPSTTGIEAPAPVTQLSRKQHATTPSQFAQITNSGEAATDDDI